MKEMVINLDKTTRRPVAKLDWFSNCNALLDTGALVPVWTAPVDILIELGAKLYKRNVSFSGFGGEAHGDLYRINFKLKDVIYVDMPIVAKETKELNCSMLLPATMFEKMIYTIDDVDKKIEIRIPDNQVVRNLRLSNDKDGISVYLAGTYETVEEFLDGLDKNEK